MKKAGIVLLLMFTFVLQSFSGDRKVEVLEVLYNQHNYRSIVRKTDKLIDKNGYANNELIHLFKAVAYAQLSKDKKYLRANPDAISKSTEAFVNYYELDKALGFVQKESVLLDDLRSVYKTSSSVKMKTEAYEYLMGTPSKPPVVIKERVVIVKNETSEPVKYGEDFKAETVDTVCTVNYLSEEDKMINYAKKFIGVPYIYGATGDGGFDCSGYTQYIYSRYGYELPRSARYQKTAIEQVNISEAKKGDLVFFSSNKKESNITHVGIVISEEGEELTMIHASSSRGIMITNVATNSYWKPKMVAVGRPVKEEAE